MAEAKRPCRLCGLTSEAHQDYHPGIQHGFEAERVEPAALDLDFLERFVEKGFIVNDRDVLALIAEAREARRLRDLLQAWEPRVTCPQCGQRYAERACGPTHALL